MTVIAWDGVTLAADKRSTLANMPHTTTKIVKADDGSLIGAAGDTGLCRTLRVWYSAGADPEKYPDKDGKCDLVVITKDRKVMLFMCTGHPVQVEDAFFAMGSGRDFAISAMALGQNSRQAIEFACRFDVNSGNGIDTLTLDEPCR